MEIYRIENLTFSYPKSENNVLNNISFSVHQGELITVCGYSGCGKSTLLRQLKTCLQPYGKQSGKIIFKNKPLSETDFETQSRKIGFVTQSPDNQSVTDKVWHELAFGLENLSLNTSAIRKRVAETASFFGMEKWFDKSIDELSGGQKQILNLASVMIMQPEVLILDEPTSQLDPIASEKFISAIKKINLELGTTIIMSEHNLNEIFPLSNRLIVLSDGKIISDTTPQNTGKILYFQKNPMFSALPPPVQIYSHMIDTEKYNAPLTVCEGRKWLSEYSKGKKIFPTEFQDRVFFDEETVLELKNIWFRYERNLPDVLKGVNLKLHRGEFLAVLGGNGSGKTTMFSVIGGINKAYRGEIFINGKSISKNNLNKDGIAILPQNPTALFVKNTVEEDLYDIFSDSKIDNKDVYSKIKNVKALCGIENISNHHPFDLSGGECQKAALAKILLKEPKILLLDEPTKGLDVLYKKKFAKIIRFLVSKGISVIMVSHDIEFCAEYADRCAMFFNGNIVSENTSHLFFSDNNFYTTSASRMSRCIIPDAVTVNDVLHALGKKISDNKDISDDYSGLYDNIFAKADTDKENITIKKNQKKLPLWRKILSVFSVIFFIFSVCVTLEKIYVPYLSDNKFLGYFLIFVSIALLVISLGKSQNKQNCVKKHINTKKSFKYRILTSVTVFIIIPLTIFVGIYYFDNTKYLFISLLVMLECMFPFFWKFEKQNIHAREIVLLASICALCVSGRVVFYMLPQFKPITALVILSGAALGSESGFLVGAVTMLVSNMFFGQGAWTPWQMFAMGIIGLISGLIYEKSYILKGRISFSLFGFISVLIIYGGIMNFSSLILSHIPVNFSTITAFYVSGFPMDIIHGLSTAIFLYIGTEPILQKLERIKIKYGLGRI